MTTTTEPQFETIATKVRRDQWGRYLVVPPGGERPVGYARATTVAKTLTDQGSLFPWSQVMAMTGMMRRPGLRARFEALMSQHPLAGPWYGGDEAKAEAKRIAAECKEAGGATDRADIGTGLHSIIIEQVLRGQQPLAAQPETQADMDAFSAAVAATGIEFYPEYTETVVVHDAWRIAGTADMLRVTVPGEGDFVGDLKTGATLDFSMGEIAQQLAMYATADAVYRQGAALDGSEDRRLPMPEVSTDRAIVFHLPAGEARCQVYWVDISAGAEAVKVALWVRRWRSDSRNLFSLFDPPRKAVNPTIPADAVDPTAADEVSDTGEGRGVGPTVEEVVAAVDQRKRALYARYDRLSEDDKEHFGNQLITINKDDLDEVEALLDRIENPPPILPQIKERQPAEPEPDLDSRLSAEGGAADQGDINIIAARWELTMVDPPRRWWLARVVREALDAEVDFRFSQLSSRRRVDIYCAITEWAGSNHFSEDTDDGFRAALNTIEARDPDDVAADSLGFLLGTLTTEQASALRSLVSKIVADEVHLIFDHDGVARWRLTPATTPTTPTESTN